MGPGPSEEVGIKYLQCQGFPAACRSAGEDPGVGLMDDSETGFDLGDELFDDGITEGAAVGRVDGVGIVEVGARMLERDH